MAAPDDQKMKYLSSIDSDFAKAPPDQQKAYLAHITGGAQQKTQTQIPPPEQPGIISRTFSGVGRGLKNVGSGLLSTGDLANEIMGPGALNPNKPTLMSMAQQSADQYKKIGETENDPYLANHPGARVAGMFGHTLGMIPGVGPWAANMGETIGKNAGTPGGDVAGPVAEAATTIAAPKLASMAIPAIAGGVNAARESVGSKVFTPEGKLSPIGEAIAHPIDKGTEFGLRKLFPPPQPEGVGATEPSAGEFYENKGKDLMRRGTQQATLDRAAARAIPKPIKGAITIGEGAGSTLSNVPRDTAPLTPPTSGLPEGQQNVQFVKDFQKPKIAAQPKGTVDINSGNSSGLPSMVGSGVGEPTPLKPVLVKAFTPQVEEGIPGSTINPKGRQILLPSEVETDAQGNIRPKGYAASKIRAHENGMAYASGARPAYGGRVPRGATPTTTFENPSQPRSVTKFPWLDEEEQ